MNILYDNIIFALQKSGGISVFWSELTKRILSTKEDISFIECESAQENLFRKNLNIPSNLIITESTKNIKLKRYFSPKLKITKNTIFHSSYYRVIKQKNVANITTVHDFIYEYYRKGLVKFINSLQKKIALKNSDLIICISENTKKDLLTLFPKIPQEKIRVIHNGVSDDFYCIAENKSKQEIPFTAGTYLIYVGDRKAHYKNFLLLIQSMPSNSTLLIAGGGQPTHKEMAMIKQYLKPDQYKFTGYITNNDLNILYNNAKALIYPSTYEGFGIPILEAQKAGCPVIALNKSSIPEVAGDGAILLSSLTADSLGNAIKKLDDPSFKQNLISTAFKNVKNYSWDEAFKKTNAAYLEIWQKKFEL